MRKSLLLSIPITLLTSCLAMAEANAFYFEYDVQIRDMRFDGGAQHLFDNTMPQNNLSIGMAITPALSIEGSFFQSRTMDTYRTLNQGEAYFGGVFGFASQRLNTNSISLDTVNKIQTHNTARIHGFKLGVKETLPLTRDISLHASLGLSRTTLHLTHTITRYYTADEAGTPNQNNQLTFSDTKLIPSAGVAISYKMIPSLLLNFGILWEQTGKFKGITPEETNIRPGQSVVDPENSVVYSLGLIYQF